MAVYAKKVCKFCGNNFTISEKDAQALQEKGFPLPERCKPCNDLKKDILILECHKCNTLFEFSAMEEQILKKKFGENYKRPKKCKICRSTHREVKTGKDKTHG